MLSLTIRLRNATLALLRDVSRIGRDTKRPSVSPTFALRMTGARLSAVALAASPRFAASVAEMHRTSQWGLCYPAAAAYSFATVATLST